jgi:hypothetical protein
MKTRLTDAELEAAIWAGDVDTLHELAGCVCCCDEHFFEDCPARRWGGCRGQFSMTRAERESWQKHYERFHGMSWKQFYGIGEIP